MSGNVVPNPGQGANLNVRDVGGTLVVPTQPSEMVYPLRRDQFELLCEAETINDDKRWRDCALAFLAAAVAGFIGLLATLDWDSVFTQKHWPTVFFTGILGVVTLSSFVLFLYFARRVHQKPETGGFSRVKLQIKKWYEEHP